jgi:hypothetical protein
MTMLTDGIKSKSLEEKVRQLDVAELLERACDVVVPEPRPIEPPIEAEPFADPAAQPTAE